MIRQNQKILNRFQVILDCICLTVSLVISHLLTIRFQKIDLLQKYIPGFYVLVLIVFFFLLLHQIFYKIFSVYTSYRSTRFISQISTVLKANLWAYAILAFLFYFLGVLADLQIYITVFFFLHTLLLLGYRYFLRKGLNFIRSKGYNKKYLLLVGVNDCAEQFVSHIQENGYLGYEFIGYLDQKQHPKQQFSFAYLGNFEQLESCLADRLIDEVIIMLSDHLPEEIKKMIDICEKWGVKFSIIPNIFSVFSSRIFINSFDGLPVLNIRQIPLDNWFYSFLKRSFDIVVSLMMLLVLGPFMLIVALIIRFSSKGPVLFSQTRVGLNRREFQMYKFRSMRTETESIVKMTTKDDDRCTPFGKLIRKFSIDELPQLYNVLRGEMSLVGPRPEIPAFVDQFKEYIPSYMMKHYIKPGMTGWAQIHGLRGNTSIPDRIQYDMYYIENWTFWLDIKIMILTLFKGIFNKNAY